MFDVALHDVLDVLVVDGAGYSTEERQVDRQVGEAMEHHDVEKECDGIRQPAKILRATDTATWQRRSVPP